MVAKPVISGIADPANLQRALIAAQYLADDALATKACLAPALGKPLLLQGAPGVGKTEAAMVLRVRAFGLQASCGHHCGRSLG